MGIRIDALTDAVKRLLPPEDRAALGFLTFCRRGKRFGR
jgi:hypothetical protein